MRYKYLQRPGSNLGAQEQQDQMLTAIASQPTTGDKAIMAVGQGLTQLLKYNKGQQILKAKSAEEKAQRDEQILDMKFKAGVPLEDKDFIDLGIDPVKGREWENQKMAKDQPSQIELYRAGLPSSYGQKTTPDREYTNVTLVKDPAGQKPGWYNVRNVFNRDTQKSANYYTAYDGTPAAAMQKDAAVEKAMGDLSEAENQRLAWLKDQKKMLFYNAETKTYDENAWNTWLSKQKKTPKVEAVLQLEEQPIQLDGGTDPRSWYQKSEE